MLIFCGAPFAADGVLLSSQKVVELARSQSVPVKASELGVRAQRKAAQGAFTSFLPVLSATAGVTHFIEKATMDFGTGGGGDLSAMKAFPGTSSVDSVLIDLLGAFFGGIENSFSGPSNIYNAGLTVAQPIFAGGRIFNGYRAARNAARAQEATHERTIADIGFTAQQLYWNYVSLLKSLESIRETRAWFENLSETQQKLYQGGVIIELDLLNTKIQLDNFKVTEIKMQDALANFGDQMLLFLGLPTGSAIQVDSSDISRPLDSFSMPSAGDIEKRVVAREDLKALEYQLDALRAVKRIQGAAYLPMVAGYATSSYTNQYSSDEGDLKRNTIIGLSLNWTLFDWGKALRDAQKTGLQEETLELACKNLREQVRLKMIALARAVDQSRKTLAIAQEDMAIAKKALDVAKLKYDAQAITNTELLNSRNLLTGKTVACTQARINALLALEEYKIAPMASSAQSAGQSSGASGNEQ